MGVFVVFFVTVGVIILGGGIGALIWLKTRPKKLIWTARCYQLSEGIKPYPRDKDGNIMSKIRLHDLIPYVEDLLERIEAEHGIVSYHLQKLDLTTNAVTADMVERWGKDKKEVTVLIDGSTATVLRKGYDKVTGKLIFNPMPRDRIENIKSEMAIKKQRFKDKQSILATITPWIVAGVLMVGMVAAAFFHAEGIVKSQEIAQQTQAASDANNLKISQNLLETGKIIRNEIDKEKELGIVEKPPPSMN